MNELQVPIERFGPARGGEPSRHQAQALGFNGLLFPYQIHHHLSASQHHMTDRFVTATFNDLNTGLKNGHLKHAGTLMMHAD